MFRGDALLYSYSAYLFKGYLPAAPELRHETSELAVHPHTITDPFSGESSKVSQVNCPENVTSDELLNR